ncbi:MAG: GtrA family protein [Verrucomicrobiales bacterium]|nr:GtrA family protein [Verrucomicrobiales bacterium]
MGLGSTVVHLTVFALISHYVFPAHGYLNIEGLDAATREKHAIWSNLIAFPFSNFFAYFTNAKFVFTKGRHSTFREVFLFTAISFLSFIAGLLSGPVLISRGLDPWIAQFGFMISSALVNFVSRKFFVFSR